MDTKDILHIDLADESATQAHARALALVIAAHRGDIASCGLNLRLTGDLGAGKTTFTRELLRALGVTGRVKSPTFELVSDYRVLETIEFHHFDFYRFADPTEFEDAGFGELYGPGHITASEWSQKALPYLPDADLEFTLTIDGTSRQAQWTAGSDLGRTLLKELANE